MKKIVSMFMPDSFWSYKNLLINKLKNNSARILLKTMLELYDQDLDLAFHLRYRSLIYRLWFLRIVHGIKSKIDLSICPDRKGWVFYLFFSRIAFKGFQMDNLKKIDSKSEINCYAHLIEAISNETNWIVANFAS